MDKFPICVVLTRVGGFYELYFEHAEEVGPLLSLKVSQRKAGPGTVAMAGFPFYQLDRMLRVLVQEHHKYVAISEEYPNEMKGKLGGLMFDRRISRIITPGTLIDEKFLDAYDNNYLLALSARELLSEASVDDLDEILSQPIGLAWLDLSTGDFFTQESTMADLGGDIARIGPREVVVSDKYQGRNNSYVVRRLEEDKIFVTYSPEPPLLKKPVDACDTWEEMLERPALRQLRPDFSELEIQAGTHLLQYVKAQLPGLSVKLQPPIKRLPKDIMGIDSNSMRSLEIKQTIRDRVSKGSLMHTIKRTVTKSGTRLLSSWLSSPITCLTTIEDRLNIVEFFYHNGALRDDIIALLKRTHDSQRLAQRFSFGRGSADDLLSLARTIELTRSIQTRLSSEAADGSSLERLLSRLDIPINLAQIIISSIDEEGLMLQQKIEESETAKLAEMEEAAVHIGDKLDEPTVNYRQTAWERKETDTSGYYEGKSGIFRAEPWLMSRSASPTLKKLHTKLDRLFKKKQELTEQLREKLGVASLTLKWASGQGHFCHIKGKDIKAASLKSPGLVPIGSSRTTKTFQHPDWTELGLKIELARHHVRTEEQAVFRKLRDEVINSLVVLRHNGAVLDELDITTSFATLAHEKNLTRPILNKKSRHEIIGGRHPMVEDGLWEQGRTFIPNDCIVGTSERLWLITGPNMAGKSTFLRQNALISILAQVGCFVPADHAEIGLVDQVFSRVGSADNLFRDQSTFMIEMLETANILRKATSKSFVIIDELGRGTAPTEGSAIAFACLAHLYEVNKSRTLFATHFHDVADWTHRYRKVGYYCTDVQEHEDGGFTYVHKLRKGVNSNSHALIVAKLAGIPQKTIKIAKEHIQRRQG
ncbi:hypothetical protein L211DRAFT_813503 [Terfezia boudieri ATCC MYA-4762]|uniref:DNA mismatch repair proteins mutS family domain-containing protein n=1 Tax=Terfezia boudieri ATCC MYA-4762 TaxID=1051890 RepID=A0A3N4LFP5_9PEZI|nr:hypothetical protein L211DRAFT_813503 [Terfezia boudieri ATCC MYA-4762]